MRSAQQLSASASLQRTPDRPSGTGVGWWLTCMPASESSGAMARASTRRSLRCRVPELRRSGSRLGPSKGLEKLNRIRLIRVAQRQPQRARVVLNDLVQVPEPPVMVEATFLAGPSRPSTRQGTRATGVTRSTSKALSHSTASRRSPLLSAGARCCGGTRWASLSVRANGSVSRHPP